MNRKHASGGIERKFLTSILWVGVIPVVLALIIGYVFARESQQIAVQQSLSTAVSKSAAGIQLALQGRLQMAARVAQSSEVLQALQSTSSQEDSERLTRLLARLRTESERSGVLESSYSLYDNEARLLITTHELSSAEDHHPEWIDRIFEPSLMDFYFSGIDHRYAVRFVTPVHDPIDGRILGYLSELQGVLDIFEYALDLKHDNMGRDTGNRYEIFHLASDGNYVFHRQSEPGENNRNMPRHDVMDAALAQRLTDSGKDNDVFTLWKYRTPEATQPVLMAYQRLHPRHDMYLAVYRPIYLVHRNINFAYFLTLVVSSLVICFFVIITYRFVNNNIIRPVSLLNEGAQIIRHGDLDLKLKIDTGDEIEELASSFNKMATALRHNLNRLAESEERYRSLFNTMRDGIYQTDSEGNLSLINPVGVDILGYDKLDELININLRELFIDQIDFARITNELAKYRYVERSRVWMRTKDNRSICVELSANQVFDVGGVLLGIEGSFRDVTQNVQLEREAKEHSDRISAINQIANVINSSLEAGRVFETIVDEMRHLIHFDYASVVLHDDKDDTYTTHQLWPGFHTSTKKDNPFPPISSNVEVEQEQKTLIIDDVHKIDGISHDLFPAEIQSCLSVTLYATGRIIGTLNLGANENAAFNKHDAEVVNQMAHHVAVAISNTQLLENLQQSLEEVTRARERLHEAIEELKTLDEMKTNLLSNVSHELRTPLVAVMGYNDMILNGKVGPVNDMQREYLTISLRNIEKLVTLIENLLDFSRLHRGTEELMFDTFDLVDCAKAALDTVRPSADSRHITLQLNVFEGTNLLPDSTSKILVEGDKGKLGQVFINLLSNAIKFNDDEGSVTIDIRLVDTNIEISVTDTGIGMPEEALDKIFTRFYQYDGSSTRKYGGTGIGLSIAQDIMRLHGSRITVNSTVGVGTQFSFIMTLSNVDARAAGDISIQHEPLPVETHLLVALISQDRALSSQIRNMLFSEGIDVIHAVYPEVASILIKKYHPDCILLDSETSEDWDSILDDLLEESDTQITSPVLLISNDDVLPDTYRGKVAGKMKRSFRKSTLLSSIHFVLSRGPSESANFDDLSNANMQIERGEKILCVDDDPEILIFMQRCLEAGGYHAVTCSSGKKALELLKAGGFWLVLLDIAMPDMDGWEICRIIKSAPELRHLRIFFVTAKSVEQHTGKIHAEGADGYILKPFKPGDLLSLVQEYDSNIISGLS